MRVIRNDNTIKALRFTQYLTDIGGNSPNLQRIPNTELVRIPDALLTPTNKPHTPKTLIDMVFPEIFSEKIENNNSIITPRI